MSRHETLPEQDEQFIQRQIESGHYDNRNDVIHAGLEMLREFDEGLESWIQNELPGRYAELQNDPSKAISFEDAFADFKKTSQADLAKAK